MARAVGQPQPSGDGNRRQAPQLPFSSATWWICALVTEGMPGAGVGSQPQGTYIDSSVQYQ